VPLSCMWSNAAVATTAPVAPSHRRAYQESARRSVFITGYEYSSNRFTFISRDVCRHRGLKHDSGPAKPKRTHRKMQEEKLLTTSYRVNHDVTHRNRDPR
jgi:hypothetical protein